MTLHKSLRRNDALERQRSVLTRWERIAALKKDKKWKEGDSVFGLPKVRTVFRVRKAKPAEKKEEGSEEAEKE